jgi:hypothetical protein
LVSLPASSQQRRSISALRWSACGIYFIRRHPGLRTAVLSFVVVAFVATGVAGAFGAFLNKYAPVRGGPAIHILGGETAD